VKYLVLGSLDIKVTFLQTALNAIENNLPKEAIGELKGSYRKSEEALEIFKQQETKMEDFPNICLCTRVQAS
jgi:hypothetical protein